MSPVIPLKSRSRNAEGFVGETTMPVLEAYVRRFLKRSARAFSDCSGSSKPVLTQYRADQGIDFFGRMSIADLTGHGALFPVFETDLVFWLVGQAKHYPDSKVSTPDLRALAGSVFLGRARAFPREGPLPQLSIRACDPVIMLFFTTGQISSDGWALCRRAGIVAMDGEMLAAFLADKQVGMEFEGGTKRFSLPAFAQWLGLSAGSL